MRESRKVGQKKLSPAFQRLCEYLCRPSGQFPPLPDSEVDVRPTNNLLPMFDAQQTIKICV